jgi:hypothetical protein
VRHYVPFYRGDRAGAVRGANAHCEGSHTQSVGRQTAGTGETPGVAADAYLDGIGSKGGFRTGRSTEARSYPYDTDDVSFPTYKSRIPLGQPPSHSRIVPPSN